MERGGERESASMGDLQRESEREGQTERERASKKESKKDLLHRSVLSPMTIILDYCKTATFSPHKMPNTTINSLALPRAMVVALGSEGES